MQEAEAGKRCGLAQNEEVALGLTFNRNCSISNEQQGGVVMPYRVSKLKSGKVRISGPSGVHMKHGTQANAKKQLNLLRALDHGWKPSR